jgi:hypothetical protein
MQGLVRGIRPPYVIHFGTPSYEVCGCCGFEFGNDDDPGTTEPVSFEEYLSEWRANSCKWFNESLKPAPWSLTAQLKLAEGNNSAADKC